MDPKRYFTKRELEILNLLHRGLSKRDAALQLRISEFALSLHVKHVLHKLQVGSLPDAIAIALAAGALTVEAQAQTQPVPVVEAPLPAFEPPPAAKPDSGAMKLAQLLISGDKDAFLTEHRDEVERVKRKDEARRISAAMALHPFTNPLELANESLEIADRQARGLPAYTLSGLVAMHFEHPTILADPRQFTTQSEATDIAAVAVVKRVIFGHNRLEPREGVGIEILRQVADRLSPLVDPASLPELVAGPHRAESLDLARNALAALEETGRAERTDPESLFDVAELKRLVHRFPLLTGFDGAVRRRSYSLEIVADALRGATPNDNLYEVLEAACDRIANEVKHGSAALDPNLLLELVSADPAQQADVRRLLDRKGDGIERGRALELLRILGSTQIGSLSFQEIAKRAAAIDPIYDVDLVQRLVQVFPELFGVAKPSLERRAFLLAHQVADVMDRMFTGATLDDVAEFLNLRSPGFKETYPGFCAADIRALRSAFDFLPTWEVKSEETAPIARASRMSIKEVVELSTSQLLPQGAGEIAQHVLEVLEEGLRTEKIPPSLEALVNRHFRSAAIEFALYYLGEERRNTAERPERRIALLRGAITGPGDASAIGRRLRALGIVQSSADRILALVAAADRLDTVEMGRILEHAGRRMPVFPSPIATQFKMLALSRETLLSRVESDVFRNQQLRAAYQRMSRIPLRLPMVQQVVERHREAQPFKNTNVLMVQHMLGQTYSQVSGYQQLGMDPKRCILIGVPYHRNPEVEEAVAQSFGIDVRVPPRDIELLKAEIRKGVDDLVARHRENGEPCLIVCDGPEARTYFMEKYGSVEPKLLESFRFTEQTAFGDRPEFRKMGLRCVSYARTRLKAKEARFVGQSIARAFQAHLHKMGTGYEEKLVLIRGMGSIGWATADAFAGDRAHVAIYDPIFDPNDEHYDPVRGAEIVKEAKARGFRVMATREEAANAGAFLQVGCAGYLSMGEMELKSAKSGSFVGSGSSKQVEIAMRILADESTDDRGRVRKVRVSQVNEQETWAYWMNDGRIVNVVADGFPVNFNDLNVVPPEFIDMTMSLSLASAAQAMMGTELKFEDLNREEHDLLDDYFEGYLDQLERGEVVRSF